jgi:hypothetical protein
MPRSLDELLDKRRLTILVGSVRSGKTWAMLAAKAKRAAWEKKNGAVPKGAKESEAYYLKMRNELGVAPR